jgi:hypothetical protein
LTTTQYIEIRDSTNKTVALLSPKADGLRVDTAYIDGELNSNCFLSFELPATSEKWQYVTDAYEFLADGKRFILLKPDTEEVVRDGKKVWGKVTAQEKWIEMDKQYVTVSNDPNSPGPAWSAVIIVSGGTPAGGYPAGSAGSALTYVLAGSGWTLLTCDVTGTFDLETEKISVLANIQKVQELWGGNLFWDSENKTVSLRDETLYQNYTGFQVRYAKNLKGITRTVNRDLVTRLYPFGYEDLNIGAVNGGVIYLDNFTHTSKIYEGKYENQDITDATELETKAIAELARLCKPRYTYKITMLDLSVKPQWAHETFSNGDMADVIDLDVGANDRARITRHKYNIFQKWKCEVNVGEPLEKLSSRISDVSAVTEKVLTNTGTANLLKAIINTKATEINGASGDYSCIDGVSTWWGSSAGVRNGKITRITPNGLIISDDGGQTWETAIDGSGVYAKSGNVGGWVIAPKTLTGASDSKIVSGILESSDWSTTTGSQLDLVNKTLTFGGSSSYKLKVAADGLVTAKAGSIGGWTLSDTAIYHDGASDAVSSGMASGDYPFYAGKKYEYRATAPFRVTQAGAFVATKADVSGEFKVYGSSSVLLGKLYEETNGGRLNIYDNAGDINVAVGSELGGNVGGTILLYNDSSSKKRIAIGISLDDYGQIQALNTSGYATAVLAAAYNGSNQYGTLGLFNSSNNLQTIIKAASNSYFLNSLAIGKNSASYMLDVSGDINCTGSFRTNGTAGVSGTYTTINSITFAGGIVTAIS